MTLDSFDAFFYTSAFLVPGFILQSTISAFVPQKGEDTQLTLLRLLTFSCINYALWSWLIYLIYQAQFFLSRPIWAAIAWGLIILISPLVLGLITGKLNQAELIRKALQRLGFNPIHVIPTAWDYKFNDLKEGRWIIVTLENGSEILGFFGAHSFASSEMSERDIYVQKMFQNKNGTWEEIPRSDGILISGNKIRHIEFLNQDLEETNAEG